MPVNRTIFILPLLLFFACARPQPYVASRAALERLQPNREFLAASKGCSVCHKIFADSFAYRYYPVRISHKAHARLGIECTFCHRKASTSTGTEDYLMPAGHGFSNKTSENAVLDCNPCRVCHIYSSPFMKKERRQAMCKSCHLSYSSDKPLPYTLIKLRTNLRSNHKAHYDKGIPCLRCHAGFDLLESPVSGYIPKMDICYECHGASIEKKAVKNQKEPDLYLEANSLYRRNCAMCHGTEGKGDGPMTAFFSAGLRPRDLFDTAHMAKRSDQQLHTIIQKGGLEFGLSERMPAWEELLTEEEVSALVKYIRHISERR